ncbi:MAG: Maf family protein [Rhodoblastus sp.]
MLESAGVPFEAVDSRVDERGVEGIDNLDPCAQAASLALAKANAVSLDYPGRIVVGADQTLAFRGRPVHKASSVDHALKQLRELRGESSSAAFRCRLRPRWRYAIRIRRFRHHFHARRQ